MNKCIFSVYCMIMCTHRGEYNCLAEKVVLLKCPTTKWFAGYVLLCVCVYLGMLRRFTHFSTGKCIRMSSLHGCGTELIVYCTGYVGH